MAEHNLDATEVMCILGFLDEAQTHAKRAWESLMTVIGGGQRRD